MSYCRLNARQVQYLLSFFQLCPDAWINAENLYFKIIKAHKLFLCSALWGSICSVKGVFSVFVPMAVQCTTVKDNVRLTPTKLLRKKFVGEWKGNRTYPKGTFALFNWILIEFSLEKVCRRSGFEHCVGKNINEVALVWNTVLEWTCPHPG